ncbi:hypothetical protein BHF70_05890 [Anaerostipes sp. 494a]|uniref:glycosyltransferase family 2 protein n=1 Tax=Anaerostipes sp. 494a TaxID=1261636 RepID=UPI000952BBDB|nr:glycosyltransferase family 2 protein [Anaerostipes sp. 494a]OLR59195.1 hypothetical protein BHF70_05890 [Anaerostipes sp. 494a]
MNKKVSIIIPVYNTESYIERCVKSLVSSTYKNIELILINDASSDNSFGICQELSNQYSCIRLLNNKKNRGVSYTRNRGLRFATGELIMFTDSDDWVENDYVERMVEEYYRHENALIICGYVNHDEVKNERTDIFAWKDFQDTQIVNRKSVLYELYEQRLLQQLWNKIFQRKVIEEGKLCFDETISIGEDFRFILQYIKMAQIEQIVKYNYPLYHYSRDNQDSLMTKYGQEKIEEPLYNFHLLYELMGFSEEKIEKLLQEQKKEIAFQYGYAILHHGKLTKKEKIQLMKENIGEEWKDSYKKNKKLLIKEKIISFIQKTKKGELG